MLQEISYEDIPNSKYISTDKCDISLNDNDKKYSIPYNTTGGYTWIYNTKTCPVTITKMVVPNLGNRFSHKIDDADTPKEYRNLIIS